MRVPVLFRAASVAAILLVVAVACLARTDPATAPPAGDATVAPGDPDPTHVPDLKSKEEGLAEYRDGTWFARGPGWVVVLRRIEAAERVDYMERNVGLAVDPFGSPPGKSERYMTWLLVLENTGEGNLAFNPRTAWLKTARDVVSPITLTDLSFDFRVLGGELPPAYEKVRGAVFERPVQVAPGAAVSGLLVYRSLPPKTRKFTLDLRVALPDGEQVKFAAPYRRAKKSKSR